MAANQIGTCSAGTCPWCEEPIVEDEPETVGPPPRMGDAHAFEMHPDCADHWAAFVDRARELASRGGRETLVSYPIENGTDGVRQS